MKDILFIIQFLSLLAAIACFFWALNFRQDQGDLGPRMGFSPKKLIEFYGPKGAKIALFGSISFVVSATCGAIGHFLK